MKKLLFTLVTIFVSSLVMGQTTTENYIYTTNYQTKTTSGSVSDNDKIESITYFDGLGRPKQQIGIKNSSNQKDIVTIIEYDEFGRQSKQYLPFEQQNGVLRSFNAVNISSDINAYYKNKYSDDFSGIVLNDVNAYSESVFEASPLNRVIEQAAPGKDWKSASGSTLTINESWPSTDFGTVVSSIYSGSPPVDFTINEEGQMHCFFNIIGLGSGFKFKLGNIKFLSDDLPDTDLGYLYDTFFGVTTSYHVSIQNGFLHIASPNQETVKIINTTFSHQFNFDNSSGGKTMKFEYGSNLGNEVKSYKVSTSFADNTYTPTLIGGSSYYTAGELYKTVTKDENWMLNQTYPNDYTIEEFKNKQGQIILKRTYNGGVIHDSYYVYDSYGNLTYVIPPKADVSITTAILDELCYQYKYDSRNRLVEKKIPGKQWEFIVYDKLDRPIATGPALSPFTSPTGNGWLITKYDTFDRPVISAWLPSTTVTSAGRKTLQDARDAELTNFSETKIATTSNTTINGVAFRYTNAVYPFSGYHVLSVNYYDDYNFPNAPTISSAVEGQTVYYNTTLKPKGLATGTWTRVLETSTLYKNEIAYTLYDYKARPIRSYVQNYLGGYTYVDSKLDFTGKPEYTVTKHKLLSTSTELTTKEEFVYTAQGRLLTQTHQINGGTKQLITKNDYDELGQLIGKKVGGTDITGAVGLQTVNYAYNIRGWLKQINDPNILGTDLFGFKINYNTASHGATPLYNGNISETEWKTQNDNVLRWYKYGYDNLNRITSGVDNTVDTRYSLSSVAYDKNGNITNLTRRGQTNIGATTFGVMDQLTYTYQANSNKLTIVSDVGNDTFGFKDDQIGTGTDITTDYTYDANGNMLKDLNKGMTSNITYNHLNLPTKVTFASGNISYIYDATGVKLRKIVSTGTTTDYAGNYVYENNVLKFFNTSEGYVEPNGSTYNYVYQFKDHLGNIRLSYKDTDSNGIIATSEIIEENNYYPFGLKHQGYNTAINGTHHKYMFGGKEFDESFQTLNTYDFGARNYDPALGRWMNIDPLAETTMQPYSAFNNNPIRYNDPTGMIAEDPGDYYGKNGEHLGTDGKIDRKVYHADSVTKDKNGLVTSAANAKEWNYSISDNKFQEYLPTLLEHEGGFVNHPKDPGVSTNKGITLKTFEKYSMDLLNVQPTLDNLKRLTDNQVAAIYEVGYWNPSGAGNISDKQTGWLHFDTYVNGGASNVLGNTIKAYGGSGRSTNTLNSIIKGNSGENVFNTYKQERLNRYDLIIQSNPKLEAFRKGWTNRVNRFQYQKN